MKSNRTIRSIVWTACTIAMFVSFAGQASAQFREIPVPKTSSEERRLAKDFSKSKIQETPAAVAALKKVISAEMARLTQRNEINRYALIRNSLSLTYLSGSKGGAARKIVVQTIVNYAGGIAKSKEFSPQTRINCMAMLAELDDQSASGSSPPLPSKLAFSTLANVTGAKYPAYLRAIALHGLRRQMGAYWNTNTWTPEVKRQIGSALLGIVKSKPKTDMDLQSNAWLVRRAYDCIGVTRSAGLADHAISQLVDEKELPSLRLAAADYLSRIDSRSLKEEQKSLYAVGLSHLVRSQLVHWYEHEEDLIKRASGGSSGMGMGYGMGMGAGYGGGEGGYGGEGGGGEGGYGMGGGMGGGYGGEGMGMGAGYGGSARSKKKAIDVQDWETIHARRRANQLSQVVHTCLDGFPVAEKRATKLIGIPLVNAWTGADDKPMPDTPDELKTKIGELILALDAFQTAVNDIEAAADTSKLLATTKTPIEDIMDLVLEVPGFAEQYPDLVEGEELDTVPLQPAQDDDPNQSGSDQPAGEPGGGEATSGSEAAAGSGTATPN